MQKADSAAKRGDFTWSPRCYDWEELSPHPLPQRRGGQRDGAHHRRT